MQAFKRPAVGLYVKCIQASRSLHDAHLWSPVSYNVCRGMAGHSNWANIKHTKATKDAERQKAFLKFSRMMKLAIREGGSADPRLNSKLGKAVEIARSNNMPVASIENVIKSGQRAQDNAKPFMLEFRGPGGVFLLAELLTDNITRTKQLLSAALKKFSVQEVRGSAHHLFDEKGVIATICKDMSFEQAIDTAIETGAEDVTGEGENFVFTCAPEDFMKVKQALESPDIVVDSANIEFLAKNPVTISDEDMEKLQMVLEKMENVDDVMKIHVNL